MGQHCSAIKVSVADCGNTPAAKHCITSIQKPSIFKLPECCVTHFAWYKNSCQLVYVHHDLNDEDQSHVRYQLFPKKKKSQMDPQVFSPLLHPAISLLSLFCHSQFCHYALLLLSLILRLRFLTSTATFFPNSEKKTCTEKEGKYEH